MPVRRKFDADLRACASAHLQSHGFCDPNLARAPPDPLWFELGRGGLRLSGAGAYPLVLVSLATVGLTIPEPELGADINDTAPLG